jgi:catechol 2,3-dioxygenase-like lactoylglutathione lyase family enzyme
MTVPQRISLVTLGVADVRVSTAFYERLGWRRSSASVEGDVTFIETPGAILGLWSADELARDAGRPGAEPPPRFRGVALAINLASPAAVDAALADWVAAGGTIARTAAPTEWGGYSGYAADPDGHTWEFAHNPFWPLDERGMPALPV